MDVILASVRFQSILVYLDDIPAFTKSVAGHSGKHSTRCVKRLLEETEVTFMLKKRKLFTETIEYPYYIIRYSRLPLVKHTTRTMGTLEHPTT